MGVMKMSESVRQSKSPWPKERGHPVGKPFGHEINPRFALMNNVSANIKEMVGGNRFDQPFRHSSAKTRAHRSHGECDQADKGAAVVKIEMVWHTLLQCLRIGLVVNEEGAIPICVEERFASTCEQAVPGSFTGIADRNRSIHTVPQNAAPK